MNNIIFSEDTVKLLVVAKTIEEGIKGIKEELAHIWADYILANERELNGDAIKFKNDLIDCPSKHEDLIRILAGKNKI